MVLRAEPLPSAEQRLRALLDLRAPAVAARRLGVEHEYAVFEDGRQLDFRTLVHALGVPGCALHPTNPDVILTPSGLAVMADGLVAETASPPELLAPGAASRAADWGARGRRVLEDRLPGGLHLLPGSTHLSVETRTARADQVCLWFAQTFAPALMLMVDRSDSPGILVRPRPRRFELGGEFIEGERLQAALTFLAGAVIALEEARRLPPAVEVVVEPARRRFGWYLDRRALGPDLYADGRAALLTLRGGGTTTAQAHLEACWEVAREAIEGFATAEEIAAVDRMVRGATPLPCEDGDWGRWRPALEVPVNPFGRLEQHRPGLDLVPVSATWDYVAFEVASAADRGVLNVPYAYLGAFLDAFEEGALDDVLAEAAREATSAPPLELFAQTGKVGLFSRVRAGDALLPRDRMGTGPGMVSTARPGKFEPPPVPPPTSIPPPPSVQPPPTPPEPPRGLVGSGGFRWRWAVTAVVALVLVGGGAALTLGGGEEVEATVTPTAATSVGTTATAESSTPVVATGEATSVAVPPPVVGPIVAFLEFPATTYTVEASSPGGLPLTYRWFMEADPGEECGRKTPATSEPVSSNVAVWSHANEPPDSCHHAAPDHPFNVRVEVSDGVNAPVVRTYRGSNTGVGSQE